MRDIKFRAWNKQKKIMCYKNEDCSSSYWDGVDSSVIELINNELNSEINKEEYEFMQYTGLKDKNGVEIYEGDKVYIIPEDEYGVIEWDNETARYVVIYDDIITDFDNWYGKELEIVGNIYD